MEVKDNSAAKIDQARNRYKDAQEDLKNSYDGNLKQMKDTYDARTEKQSKNYAEHKTKLEEQNQVSNELYTEKTRSAISKGQQEFKTKLRENTLKFEEERNNSKHDLNEKLSSLSDSYKKSADENNRYENEIKKSMTERYGNASKKYQADFNSQIQNMEEKLRTENSANRENGRVERLALAQKNASDLDDLRASSNDNKYKEVSRLKNDNENLRTTFTRDNQLLKDRQEERVSDLLKMKGQESVEGMKNFENLQDNIRQKNLAAQEKQNNSHTRESKELEKKFNDDIRNIQKIATQKVKGGTAADSLTDELKHTKDSYEGRLASAREEISRNNKANTEKEESIDLMYRDKLKEMKSSNVENLAKKDYESSDVLKKTVAENREKNTAVIDRYKSESSTIKREADDKLSHVNEQSKSKISEQRVEFGRVVNTLNDKNMETINALKEDYSKDKSTSIEKSKKEFNDEKMAMKSEFSRQSAIRDSLYEQKLAEIEKQAGKIINNYEQRISQIARKAETEVEAVKAKEDARSMKEAQANGMAFDGLKQQKQSEMVQMRDKYEGLISKNQTLNEQKTNSIVQRYEDQLNRERNENQKEMAVRLSEAQSQFERLYKSSELEKQTLRTQYEQRMETMKLNANSQENSKKV